MPRPRRRPPPGIAAQPRHHPHPPGRPVNPRSPRELPRGSRQRHHPRDRPRSLNDPEACRRRLRKRRERALLGPCPGRTTSSPTSPATSSATPPTRASLPASRSPVEEPVVASGLALGGAPAHRNAACLEPEMAVDASTPSCSPAAPASGSTGRPASRPSCASAASASRSADCTCRSCRGELLRPLQRGRQGVGPIPALSRARLRGGGVDERRSDWEAMAAAMGRRMGGTSRAASARCSTVTPAGHTIGAHVIVKRGSVRRSWVMGRIDGVVLDQEGNDESGGLGWSAAVMLGRCSRYIAGRAARSRVRRWASSPT